MKRSNVVGVVSIIIGGLMWGYQALADFMGRSTHLSQSAMGASKGIDYVAMVDIFPEGNFDFIDQIPWAPVQQGVDYIVTMPLFILLIIIGVLTLVIGGVLIKK
ncbi:MAG: hypothetical protein ACKVE4_09650 [Dissulfuribacterales bacterium]